MYVQSETKFISIYEVRWSETKFSQSAAVELKLNETWLNWSRMYLYTNIATPKLDFLFSEVRPELEGSRPYLTFPNFESLPTLFELRSDQSLNEAVPSLMPVAKFERSRDQVQAKLCQSLMLYWSSSCPKVSQSSSEALLKFEQVVSKFEQRFFAEFASKRKHIFHAYRTSVK